MTRMPQVTARDLIRFFKAQGFVEDRQSGGHLTLWNETSPSPSPFPSIPATWGAALPCAS